jgi:predicted glycosyltransferase
MRRMLSIAKHLVAEQKDYRILLLSGSPMLHSFRIPQHIDYIKLPCLQRDSHGEYGVRTLGLSMEETLKLRRNIILSTVRDYQPDIMLVDKKPLGLCGELQTALEYLKKQRNPPSLFLLLRDILDKPAATKKVWHKRDYFQAIDHYYERVLVVGQENVFDLASEYAFPSRIRKKLHYCGYIRREAGLKSRQIIRAELGLQEQQKLVLVTPGGGKDGAQLISTYLHGIKNHPATELHSLVVCGPEMSEKDNHHIQHLAQQCSQVILQRFTNDLMSYMNAADAVVSMLGYNTLCEILTLQKPAVVVPRVRPVEEQWIRATRIAQLGLLQAIHPDQLTASNLYQAVKALFTSTQPFSATETLCLTALPTIKHVIADAVKQREAYTPHRKIHSLSSLPLSTPFHRSSLLTKTSVL